MNTKLLSFLASIIFFAILSCDSKDEPSIENQNAIQLNGQTFSIETVELILEDGDPTVANIRFEGLNTNGNTQILDLWIAYDENETIAGTYSFPQGDDRLLYEALTSYEVRRGIDDSDIYFPESGSVQIQENGADNYTVTINLTMEGEHVFTGFYKGDF